MQRNRNLNNNNGKGVKTVGNLVQTEDPPSGPQLLQSYVSGGC